MRVGFIITAPYQLFHYAKIQRHIEESTAYIEVRNDGFGVSENLIEQHMPGVAIERIKSANLVRIDGQCDVLVCQTPVPLLKFFTKSLMVAQQYSLAKEQYQYGTWRAQADLNLMYGEYSTGHVGGFTSAVAIGNPLFDGHFPTQGVPPAPVLRESRPRVLYMPTYGDLSDKGASLRELLKEDIELTVKAHHADKEIISLAKSNGVPVLLSDHDPIQAISAADIVVSDYSGAIYDALAMRRPVVLTRMVGAASKHLHRLSETDISREAIAGLAATWGEGEPLGLAGARSCASLSSESAYTGFLKRFYVNVGSAGIAAAGEIQKLHEHGVRDSFATRQVRETLRRYITENRTLRSSLKKATAKPKSVPPRAKRDAKAVPTATAVVPPRFPVLRRESPRILGLELARWLLWRVPGGAGVLNRLRAWRNPSAESVAKVSPPPATASDVNLGPVAKHFGAKKDLWELPPVPRMRRKATLRLLEAALAKHDLEYRVRETECRVYCAVLASDLELVCGVLNKLNRDDSSTRFRVWMGKGASYGKSCDAAKLRISDAIAADSLVVGIPYRNSDLRVERSGGVEILLLENRDVRLVAKRWRAEHVDWTSDFTSQAPEAPSAKVNVRRHALEREPVDIVYTWVDSDDEQWRRSLSEWAAVEHVELESSNNDERYIDREELRFSLRSIWLYAPFVRNIYIVTSGHRPHWLEEGAGNVRIVPHHEIFPDPSVLPTFNSHAIEASLHRIPGLAENFIYFNDDVFLGREVRRETFYTQAGLIKSRFSPSSFTAAVEPGPAAIPTDWASYNATRFMSDQFGVQFDRKMKHVPMAMKRSVLEEMESHYPEIFERTRAARFRSCRDFSIPSMLAHYYAIATGRGVEWENVAGEYMYADTGRSDFPHRIQAIRKVQPTFLCLNVTKHTDFALDRQAGMLQTYLKGRYPIASPYERRASESNPLDPR